jgi:DNA (cytosine-5)-methyltransferase 1
MEDIESLPWNGYNVVSTFSGAGGSCLGYRMAGFRVLWANEFIPEAQEVYKLNHPNSVLNTDDIRAVSADDILDSIALRVGEIDILDGSPPCASFSTAGKRDSGWGEVKQYSSTKQRVDDLFFEYARLLKALQPKVFVAENVSGLVKGVAKGYFKLILQALKDCGYNVKAKVLDASWLGVPQRRQRLIFIGVRNDIGLEPAHPKPLNYQYSVREAIPSAIRFETGAGYGSVHWGDAKKMQYDCVGTSPSTGNGLATKVVFDTKGQYAKEDVTNKPCNTITQQSSHWKIVADTETRKLSINELKRIMAFPDDFQLTGTYAQQWERLGRAVPPVMMYHIAKTLEEQILCKT